ncbi:hypothetical protein SORDD17_00466 [Streptococcus oralis]|uniref:DNA-binding response regulator n=1 Tax=Streptococcus oralis TaxID=1303 RepID=A0A139RNL4_STROR|nr:response regulator transcription factor [Streptococcus oralis]KXU16319.1 hypothetical protein SORDD17_00466 [Streptococcus oralis]
MARLLIIEDNSEIQEILYQLFASDYEVEQAYSGTEGILRFDQGKVDLVLLDIMLPGKGGEEVLAHIRCSSRIPVIMLTALSEKSRISQYLLAGANDYLVKPFDLEELAARVTVQLRQQGNPIAEIKAKESSLFTVKDLQFDVESFEVRKGEDSFRLAKKEALILQTLIRHPRKIFTKEELYELVWEEAYLPGDNTLNTHLSNLRKKLHQLNPNQDYIETIWGLGVRLKGEEV